MSTLVAPIVLRNGTRIESVLEPALEFVEHDGSYQSYDLASVEQDDVLTESDIRVANAMIARMSPRVIADIYARAPVINAALAQVPQSASLAAADEAIPRHALEELMRAMDGIPEVRLCMEGDPSAIGRPRESEAAIERRWKLREAPYAACRQRHYLKAVRKSRLALACSERKFRSVRRHRGIGI